MPSVSHLYKHLEDEFRNTAENPINWKERERDSSTNDNPILSNPRQQASNLIHDLLPSERQRGANLERGGDVVRAQ